MKRQISLFLVIGAIGFAIDIGGVFVLVSLLDLPAGIGRIPGLTLALTATFFLNRNITFRATASSDNDRPPPLKNLAKDAIRYLAANGISQGTNFALYLYLVNRFLLFQAMPVMAASIGCAVAAIMSFLLFKYAVFRTQDTSNATDASSK